MNMRPEASSRDIIRCAVLLLVACLVVDMATPLLPGAFRLDPSESIEATAGRTLTAGVVASDRLLVRFDPGLLAEHHGLQARRATGYSPHPREVSLFRPRLLRAFAPNESANASDDD